MIACRQLGPHRGTICGSLLLLYCRSHVGRRFLMELRLSTGDAMWFFDRMETRQSANLNVLMGNLIEDVFEGRSNFLVFGIIQGAVQVCEHRRLVCWFMSLPICRFVRYVAPQSPLISRFRMICDTYHLVYLAELSTEGLWTKQTSFASLEGSLRYLPTRAQYLLRLVGLYSYQ